MELTKENISKRVSRNGETLSLDKFSWDEKSRTFSTTESNLVLNFSDLSDCTFNTGSDCTFKTGSSCTFKTGSYCTFNTGSYCTFNTGSYCTFNTGSYCTFNTGSSCTFKTGSECVVVRRDIFEVILLKEDIQTQLCLYKIKGYLETIDGKQYLNGDISQGEYIIIDNILSKIVKRKGNILKVINHSDTEESYIVEQNGYYSHGRTLDEARTSLVYKLSTRDLSEFEELTLDSVLSKEESIRMYMSVTGACAFGTRQFIESREIKDEYSIKEIIELTIGQYGNEKLKEFFKIGR